MGIAYFHVRFFFEEFQESEFKIWIVVGKIKRGECFGRREQQLKTRARTIFKSQWHKLAEILISYLYVE